MKNGAHYPIRVNGQSKVTAEFSKFLIKNMRANLVTPPPKKKINF